MSRRRERKAPGTVRRWLSSGGPIYVLDMVLREKADWERTGGHGVKTFLGDTGASGYRMVCSDEETEGARMAMLALTYNELACQAGEVCLKALVERTPREGGRGTGLLEDHHSLTRLYEKLKNQKGEAAVEKEYRALVQMSRAAVGKSVQFGTLEGSVRELEGRFVRYRYLDEMEQFECGAWWEFRLAVEALQRAAMTAVSDGQWGEYPPTQLMTDPRLNERWRKIRYENTRQWMRRILGLDIERVGADRPEHEVWSSA